MSDNLLEKTVGESLTKPVSEVLSNVTAPVSKNVGNTLGNIWFIVFGGIDQYAEKRKMIYAHELKQFEKELDAKLGAIPEDKRIIPKTQVAMKALSETQCCIEEPILRDMFSNLIAKAANADYEDWAHPSFPSIISRLSPYDALLFKEIARRHTLPAAEMWVRKEDNSLERWSTLMIVIDGKVRTPTDTVRSSLDVLLSLGLITIDLSRQLFDQTLYEPFRELDVFKLHSSNLKSREFMDLQKGTVKISELGIRFASTCIEN